jgi:dolichyl-phosphate-mannose-protein mannosyltransferase
MKLPLFAVGLLAALAAAGAIYLGRDDVVVFVVYLCSVACIVLALSAQSRQPVGRGLAQRRGASGSLVARGTSLRGDVAAARQAAGAALPSTPVGRGPITRGDGRAVRRVPRHPRWGVALPILALVVLQLALVRYFGSFPLHGHRDEFLTAYTSYSLPNITQIGWFAGYPSLDEWVAQFPIFFFLLQKPFFMLLGPTVDAVRISVWPYLALTVVYLYLLAREISPRPAFPALACLSAMVFAPSLYIDSLGVLFHASTLFVIGSIYYVVRLLDTERRGYAIATGAFSALAYLTYTASYIVLPLLLGFVALVSLARRSTRPLRVFLPTLVVFAFVMLPFVVYAYTKENYFLQRVDQVSVMGNGSASGSALSHGGGTLGFFLDSLSTNLMSLVRPGIGGVDDYAFGHQAFFDLASAPLFALGAGYAGVRVFRGRAPTLALVGATLIAAFLSGMVLTTPSGAFHRLTPVYPLIGLTVSLGLLALSESARLIARSAAMAQRLGATLVVLAMAAFVALNLTRAYAMAAPDQSPDSVLIYRYLQERLPPEKNVPIAFDPSYHLGKELFFRTGGRRFVTEPLSKVLDDPTVHVFILAYPDDGKLGRLFEVYPSALLIFQVDGVRLEHHAIVIT